MSFLKALFNPPSTKSSMNDVYQFNKDVHVSLQHLTSVVNPSLTTNANFFFLAPIAQNPVTPADGDDFEFSAGWFVFGAANANYVITQTDYPATSTVQSASEFFTHVTVSSYNNNVFYFYQRQPLTVRKYQKNYLTYTAIINNNQTTVKKIRMDIYSDYDGSNALVSGQVVFLQPGLNNISSTILTNPLPATVGAAPFTEFRLSFIDFIDGTADLNIYQIKCEFGQMSTQLVE